MLKDVRFYHLQRQPLEAVLPKLLERVLAADMRAVVKLPDEAMMDAVDQALWTYDPAAFLPHGTPAGGHAERQPVYLTTADENPNAATALVLVNAVPAPDDLGTYTRCLYMFDGQDDAIVAKARQDWKRFKTLADSVSYWQQKDRGGWEQKG